jgi:predicted alpha-1,2-mannosidase
MNKPIIISLLCIFVLTNSCSKDKAEDSNCIAVKKTSLVDPFLGVQEGNIFPGASVPFGMVKAGPNVMPVNSTNGYDIKKNIVGFAHNQTSGTGGGPRYGNIMFIPQVGTPDVKDFVSKKKVGEYASPGYYKVRLARVPGDVDCEITATEKSGFHKYNFFTWRENDSIRSNILIDISHTTTRGGNNDARCMGGKAEIISNNEIAGFASFKGGWGHPAPYTIYFYAKFNKDFDNYGTWTQENLSEKNKLIEIEDSLKFWGIYASWNVPNNTEIEAKVSISYLSIEKAKKNSSINNFSFEEAKTYAEDKWEEQLNKIQIEGSNSEDQQLFYSCLRNTMLMPTEVTGDVPGFSSESPHFWDHYCLWDVFRTVMPLHTLIYPEKQVEILNNLLSIYDKHGWLPDSWVAGHYSDIQGGTNADVVFADAVAKDLKGFDIEKAYEACKKNATIDSDNPGRYGRYLNDYLKYGYVTKNSCNGASSRTIEYAYCDYSIATIAEKLGKKEESEKFYIQSQNVFKLFYDSVKYFWAKDTLGNWEPNFSIHSLLQDHWHDPYFYEGGSEIYSYYVPHDMAGLIKRHGGQEQFISNLDKFFDEGRFGMGNEPTFLVPYSYNYAGRPDKTAERVRNIMNKEYNGGYLGLPGQDDSGAMSSWFVFSSMGFFPVAGQDIYLIGSPLFKKISFDLSNGQTFSVIANNNNKNNIYIKSAKLNGKELKRNWFRHDEIINGGTLILEMDSEPSHWGKEAPPSMSK